MTDPIRQALETKDDAELGRILRTQHANLLRTLPRPAPLAATQPPKAGGAGTFDPNPPTPEEVSEAYRFKYGVEGSPHAA